MKTKWKAASRVLKNLTIEERRDGGEKNDKDMSKESTEEGNEGRKEGRNERGWRKEGN